MRCLVQRRATPVGSRLLTVLVLACALLLAVVAAACAQGLEDDGGASWQQEKIYAPEAPGVEPSGIPVGLGHIGDIQFWAPNRGVLITSGNGGSIGPGIWAYNGRGWHELANVCGATDGRIAWEGPDSFWTISDGRTGQATGPNGNPPPLQDNTLCHFQNGKVVASYATLAFSSTSYQPMHGAACIGPGDCWFAGDRVPEQPSSFHLHFNGSAVSEEPYGLERYAVQDLRSFQGQAYESVQLEEPLSEEPAAVHVINRKGVSPTFEPLTGLPLYGLGEFPDALRFLHLSSGEGALWGAAGPVKTTPTGSVPGQVTVVRFDGSSWHQLLGPGSEPTGSAAFPGDIVNAIAAEPGSESAWFALQPVEEERANPVAPALLARVHADGSISKEDTLSVGAKGRASILTCPAPHDCWLATTQGFLFHLATAAEELALDTDPAFAGLITERPADEGVPQLPPDTLPADTSGLPGELPPPSPPAEGPPPPVRVQVALLSRVRSRLVAGTTLELRFHLAVKARLKLLGRRRGRTVASTPFETLKAGNRRLMLRLDPHNWPTKLELKSHPLAPLPTVSANTNSPETQTVGTSLVVLPHVPTFAQVALP